MVVNLIEKGKKKAQPAFLKKNIVPWEDQMDIQLILHEGIKRRKTEKKPSWCLFCWPR